MTVHPNTWNWSTIGEVADIVRGVTYSKGDTLLATDKDAVPLLRATNLEVDSIDFEDMVYVPRRVVKPKQFLQLNDIFLAASSGSISVVGKSAQVIKTKGETFGAFCTVIRPKNVHPKFLAYWVQSPTIRDHWSATAKGTNINNLKPSDISETNIPIPPIEEQFKIVELLEDHLSRLDAALADVNRAQVKAAQFRKSLLQAAFTGQLSKNGTSIIKIPFDETFDVGSTNRKAVKQKDYLPEGKYPVIDQGELFISGYSNDESLVLDFKQPVIIFGDHTRRIKYADFPFVPGADGTKILIQSNKLHSRFAYYQLESKELRNRGYARHFSELRKEDFWVPPINVQRNVVEILETHLSHLDETIRLADLMEKQSAGLRRSLLQAAFTGQLTKEVLSV